MPPSTAKRKRSVFILTAVAAALLVALFALPQRHRLTPVDFVADRAALLQYCGGGGNVRPLPTQAGRPPVSLVLTAAATFPDGESRGVFLLTTVSGLTVQPSDLRAIGGKKLRLQVIDLTTAASVPVSCDSGPDRDSWIFTFMAARGRRYRLVASFTPAAIDRSMEASADWPSQPVRTAGVSRSARG